jgi:hypothetical protein
MENKRYALVFEAKREGYGIDQIADCAMTVGELKRILEDYDDDTLFVLSHDQGYTYGSIHDECAVYAECGDGEFREVEE